MVIWHIKSILWSFIHHKWIMQIFFHKQINWYSRFPHYSQLIQNNRDQQQNHTVIYWNNEAAPLTMMFSLQIIGFFFSIIIHLQCISKLKTSSSSWNIFYKVFTKSLCKLYVSSSQCTYFTNTCTCKSLDPKAW